MMFLYLSVLFIFYGLYLWRKNFNFWKDRGVKHIPKTTPFGVLWNFLIYRKSFAEVLKGIYDASGDEPFIGVFLGSNPSLLLKHPENIHKVVFGDFQNFSGRGRFVNKFDILGQNIAFTDDYKKWKLSRKSFSPLFTDYKLRKMFTPLQASAKDFLDYVEEETCVRDNVSEFASLFSDATLCPTLFGVKTCKRSQGLVVDMCKDVFASSIVENSKFILGNVVPSLYRVMNCKAMGCNEKKFKSVINSAEKIANEDCAGFPNFVKHVLKLKEAGIVKDRDTGHEMELTDNFIAAEAFFFAVAGIDVIGIVLTSCLIELSINNKILRKLQSEIDAAYDKGVVTYEDFTKLVYLDMVLKETLRKHPPIGIISRKCTGETELPVGGLKVVPGDKLYVPIYALHRDPNNFPNPEQFDPERFSPENIKKINKNVYLPFGGGKRTCLGQRYALLQMKVCLTVLLRRFDVRSRCNQVPPLTQNSLILRVQNPGYYLVPRKLK